MYRIFKINIFTALVFVLLIILLTINPIPCREGAETGLLLCGRVIIPSLFPFTFCILFIMKTGLLDKMGFLQKFTRKIFHFEPEMFSLMLISFIGGYPVGAKVLSSAVKEKKISSENAGIMLNYCINAGPAFIISAVGNGILGSKNLGIILLSSHLSASLILCFLSRFPEPKAPQKQKSQKKFSFADDFVLSVKEASDTTLSICSFVVLFSALNNYIQVYSEKIIFLKRLTYFTEVTNAVTLTKNIYIISFLLGFGGISIWCQIAAMSKNIKIKPLRFILFRLLHGFISSALTFTLLKLFKITVPTLSNGRSFNPNFIYSTPSVAISLFMMCVILIISISTKKFAGKITDDMI